tara:strand:- start:446 stop:1045 length:600 start_codon:yes stop_codon:yes gene_type:complete
MVIFDDFVKDKKTTLILKDKNTWNNFPSFNWWDGWWKVEPRNIMEVLIKMVWGQFQLENKIAGFEYWSNYQTAKNWKLNWHQDCDEKLKLTSNNIISPTLGQIYYIENSGVHGGYLEISNLSPETEPNPSKIERIYPRENRLIIFNPSKKHSVSEITSGNRRAFLSNVWIKKPTTFDKSENVDHKDFSPMEWKDKYNIS